MSLNVLPFLNGEDLEKYITLSPHLYRFRWSNASFRLKLANLGDISFIKSIDELYSLLFFVIFREISSSIVTHSPFTTVQDQIEDMKGFVSCLSSKSRELIHAKLPRLSNKPTLPSGVIEHLSQSLQCRMDTARGA